MHVDAEHPVVRDHVQLIADTVRGNGGYIHPDLVVRQEGASLWLSLPRTANPHLLDANGEPLKAPHPDAAPLLIIPGELFVPVTDLEWEPHDTRLRYQASTEHLTAAQRTILDAMVDLFNAVDKVRVIGQGYPTHSLNADPELLIVLREARPHLTLNDDDPASATPALRVVNSRLRTDTVEGIEGPVGFFMPMIDMLNHHPFGSRYRRTADGGWRIDIHHPTQGEEVFVRYNRADALGNVLGLGYVETATRHVSSVQCSLASAMGPVEIRGVNSVRRRLPAPTVEKNGDGWRITGLVFDPDRMATLRTLLTMPVMVAFPEQSAQEAAIIVDDLILRAIAANEEYFARLRALCLNPAPDAADPRLRAMIAEVSAHQLKVLEQSQRALAALGELHLWSR